MWTITDVDSHKKGLSDKAKKQWVRIANSVLKKCMAKGGDEESCAASAIKQANGVVNTNATNDTYSSYKNKQTLEYDVKLTTHQDKAHLVVPVVMMIEGVHNGSQGPLLHSINELGKFPESWNGIPVVIYHPEEEGVPVSANSPDVIDRVAVGRVYNTNVEGKKLKAEVWFDEDKLNAVSPDTLAAVNDMKEMEVSLGMFTENEMEEGEYNGEAYKGIAHNHRPDHLAILPDQIGACSCADGCGLGANKKDENMKSITEMIKGLSVAGYAVAQIGNHADVGFREKMDAVYVVLRGMDKDSEYHYLEEMYDDSLIYSKSSKDGTKMYKQSYKFESGKITLVGDSVEVHRKVEYVVNSGLTRNKFSTNNKKEDKKMPKNECPKCLEKINAVIANQQSGFVEADREWLETLSEAALDKTITPKVIEKEKVVEKTVEVNRLTPEQEADLAFVANQRKERRSKLVKGILDNTEKGVWEEATLTVMSEDVLERVFKSVKKEETVDYSINGETNLNANAKSGSGGALYMPGIEVK